MTTDPVPTTGQPPEAQAITRSDRDPAETRADFAEWLAATVGGPVEIIEFVTPESNGMSSDTVLVTAAWAGTEHRLVIRIAPPPTAMPVFADYRLDHQFETMRLVGELSEVPVPGLRWLENSLDALGAPFFVMDRVDGLVPPDNLPYPMGGWVLDASPEDRVRLVERTVQTLAAIHAIPNAASTFAFLPGGGTESPLRAHVDALAEFYRWMRGDLRLPLVEDGFAWLEANWPADEGPTVLSWGDSRIGNTMYRDFDPVAVLDWEMAALAPAEVDLAWCIFLHRFFEDICAVMEMPGLPEMLRRDDVVAIYEAASGRTVANLDWHLVYAALRHAVVMARVKMRAIHFGEDVMPEDPDDLVMHRVALRQLIEGTYWSHVG